MVMIAGNKFLVRTSVSVLAMVLSASMALADDETTAGTDVFTTDIVPEVVVCEMYPGPGVAVEETKDGDGVEVTVTLEEGGEELPVPVVDENGSELPIYYMAGSGDGDPDMIKRDVVPVSRHVARESVAHDTAAIPNLCDIAGPGLDWLCGKHAQ